MQSAQTVSWFQILAPSLITGLVVVLVQILLAYWLSKVPERYKNQLSKEIEDYKRDITKELETHRIQLQSEVQTQLYEFQTKYSLLHEKTADAIEKLFECLANVQMDMQRWTDWGSPTRQNEGAELYAKTKADLRLLIEYFDRKRIYFDRATRSDVISIVSLVTFLLDGHDSIEWLNASGSAYAEMSASMKANAKNIVDDNIGPLMDRLDNRFRNLLSAEPPGSVMQTPTA